MNQLKNLFLNNKKSNIIIFTLLLLSLFILYPIIKPNELKKDKYTEIGGPKVKLISKNRNDTKEKKTEHIIYLKSDDTTVKKSYKDTSWTITKSQQKEPHSIDFSEDSLDREEIITSISTSINSPIENIEIWWLDAIDNKNIVSTIQIIDSDIYLNIYLEWIDSEGWKISLVEELFQLPPYL